MQSYKSIKYLNKKIIKCRNHQERKTGAKNNGQVMVNFGYQLDWIKSCLG